VKETPQFVEMELASTSFFEPTSARLTPDGLPLLEGLARNLLRFNKSNTTIVVEGHTDDTPIATAQYPSNWNCQQHARAEYGFSLHVGLVHPS